MVDSCGTHKDATMPGLAPAHWERRKPEPRGARHRRLTWMGRAPKAQGEVDLQRIYALVNKIPDSFSTIECLTGVEIGAETQDLFNVVVYDMGRLSLITTYFYIASFFQTY
jgi:hypothetical protein